MFPFRLIRCFVNGRHCFAKTNSQIYWRHMKKISIVLVEDNRLLREGISVMLKKQPDMRVVATVGNGENILMLMDKHKPDVLLLDLGLRSHNSMEVVKLCREHFHEIKVIVMDMIPLQKDVFEFIELGVAGFLLKDANSAEFFSAIRVVFNGGQVLPPNLTGSLFSQIIEHALKSAKPSLIVESVRMTARERQIIGLVAEGLSNKEVAQKMHISTYTVKSHLHNILEKLSLHSRVQVANFAHCSDSNKNSRESAFKE